MHSASYWYWGSINIMQFFGFGSLPSKLYLDAVPPTTRKVLRQRCFISSKSDGTKVMQNIIGFSQDQWSDQCLCNHKSWFICYETMEMNDSLISSRVVPGPPSPPSTTWRSGRRSMCSTTIGRRWESQNTSSSAWTSCAVRWPSGSGRSTPTQSTRRWLGRT